MGGAARMAHALGLQERQQSLPAKPPSSHTRRRARGKAARSLWNRWRRRPRVLLSQAIARAQEGRDEILLGLIVPRQGCPRLRERRPFCQNLS